MKSSGERDKKGENVPQGAELLRRGDDEECVATSVIHLDADCNPQNDLQAVSPTASSPGCERISWRIGKRKRVSEDDQCDLDGSSIARAS